MKASAKKDQYIRKSTLFM